MIVDTAHDAFVGIDSMGRIVDWNAAAEATFGWSPAEVLGRTLSDVIIPTEYREAHVRGIQRFLDTGAAPVVNKRLELSALHRSGREFPIELTVTSPTRFGDGYFFGAFLRDISERRERDLQLRTAKESAEAATRAKSEFLANMSHELRTPLNGVLGYAQLLQREAGLTARQREALDAITKSGSHLLDVINEILDLSKIEAGHIDTAATTTDLLQLGADLRQLVAESAQRKQLRLRTVIGPDVPRAVCLDGRHVRQVLLNLLGNAIKFTNEGEVRLGITRSGDDRLLFEVVDTGIGIEPEGLATIFDAFTQTETGAMAGGSGLGLTISRHLVAMMDGDLQVESVPGSGSRFFFSLPLVNGDRTCSACAESETSSEPPLDAVLAPGQTLTALVADDSTLNRRIIGDLLESAGARVIQATGGEEAIALRTRAPPRRDFHGSADARSRRTRGHAASEVKPGDTGDSGDRGHRQRSRRCAARGARRRMRRLPDEADPRTGALRGAANASRPPVRGAPGGPDPSRTGSASAAPAGNRESDPERGGTR